MRLDELGYHPHGPARQLAAGSTRTVGLVLRQSPEQVATDAFLAEVLHGLATAVRSSWFRVLVEPLPQDEGSYAELVRARHVDGLVISGPRSDDHELAGLVEDGFPIILQGSRSDLGAASVDVDNRACARQAVEYLIALGHRRVACITNAPMAYTAASERLAGYRDALSAAGLAFDPGLIHEGAFDAESGRVAAARLARTDSSAIFVASDVVAIGALHGLREAGRRVPEDMSVVGFDDIPLAQHVDPPLTTVHLPARLLGETAGRLLLDLVDGRPVATRTILPTEFIVRDSTGVPGRWHVGGP